MIPVIAEGSICSVEEKVEPGRLNLWETILELHVTFSQQTLVLIYIATWIISINFPEIDSHRLCKHFLVLYHCSMSMNTCIMQTMCLFHIFCVVSPKSILYQLEGIYDISFRYIRLNCSLFHLYKYFENCFVK